MYRNTLNRVDPDVIKHDRFRRNRIPNLQHAARKQVQRTLRIGFAHFQMQVRAARRTPVARQGDLFALLENEFAGRRRNIHSERFANILYLMDIPLDRVRKTFQVTVNARRAIRMIYVKGLAESGRTDGDADDRAVGNRTDRLVDYALGLDIDARMEMVAAQLAVIGRQQHRKRDRRNEPELGSHRRMRRILSRQRAGITDCRRQNNPFFNPAQFAISHLQSFFTYSPSPTSRSTKSPTVSKSKPSPTP